MFCHSSSPWLCCQGSLSAVGGRRWREPSESSSGLPSGALLGSSRPDSRLLQEHCIPFLPCLPMSPLVPALGHRARLILPRLSLHFLASEFPGICKANMCRPFRRLNITVQGEDRRPQGRYARKAASVFYKQPYGAGQGLLGGAASLWQGEVPAVTLVSPATARACCVFPVILRPGARVPSGVSPAWVTEEEPSLHHLAGRAWEPRSLVPSLTESLLAWTIRHMGSLCVL